MKKLFLILVILVLSGCGTLGKQSEFWEHESVYRNWEHMKFSVYGYKKVDVKEAEMSDKQGWWGIGIER